MSVQSAGPSYYVSSAIALEINVHPGHDFAKHNEDPKDEANWSDQDLGTQVHSPTNSSGSESGNDSSDVEADDEEMNSVEGGEMEDWSAMEE
jgi:hypothetical protein